MKFSQSLQVFLSRMPLEYIIFIFKYFQDSPGSVWSNTFKADNRILQNQLWEHIKDE